MQIEEVITRNLVKRVGRNKAERVIEEIELIAYGLQLIPEDIVSEVVMTLRDILDSACNEALHEMKIKPWTPKRKKSRRS